MKLGLKCYIKGKNKKHSAVKGTGRFPHDRKESAGGCLLKPLV